MAEMPEIDREKCNRCGLCISVCSCGAIVFVENIITIIQKEECRGCNHWCTLCEDICTTGAITCPFEIVIEEH